MTSQYFMNFLFQVLLKHTSPSRKSQYVDHWAKNLESEGLP